MNMISQLRQRVRQHGKAVITPGDFDQLLAEWITRARIDASATEYPDSACEEHRSVKTSEPVCIICMAEEVERLRVLAQAHIDARDKEAKTKMSFDNAEENYSNSDPEAREYEKAMVAASAADKALRDELTPNAADQARSRRRGVRVEAIVRRQPRRKK